MKSTGNVCTPCASPCSTCFGVTSCYSCAIGFNLVYGTNNCIVTCPAGQYPTNKLCLLCNYTCATCSDASTCLTCNFGFYLNNN